MEKLTVHRHGKDLWNTVIQGYEFQKSVELKPEHNPNGRCPDKSALKDLIDSMGNSKNFIVLVEEKGDGYVANVYIRR